MLRKPRERYAVPPAATESAKNRRLRLSTSLAAFPSRSSTRPHPPHRWARSDSAFGTRTLQREQSCDVPAGGNFDEGHSISCSPAPRNVEEVPPTLLSDGPVQATLVLSPARHVADLKCCNRDEVVALHRSVGEAVEFLPSRLRLSFMCPRKRRLLLSAVLRTSPAARHGPLLPAECAAHCRLSLALHMSAIGKGVKAPDARIQTHRAFLRVRADCRQGRFGKDLNFDPPRLANDAETPKPLQRRQGPPDRKPAARQALHTQLAPTALIPDPERAPGRFRIIDTERAVPAPGPKSREPRFLSRLHPRKEPLHRPVQAIQRRARHENRYPPPLGFLFPERGL